MVCMVVVVVVGVVCISVVVHDMCCRVRIAVLLLVNACSAAAGLAEEREVRGTSHVGRGEERTGQTNREEHPILVPTGNVDDFVLGVPTCEERHTSECH